MSLTIAHVAKWICKVVEAENDGTGVYHFNITENFIPVSEIYKPYNLNADFTESETRKALLAADAVDLLPAYSGLNLDMGKLFVQPRKMLKRFFDPANNIVEGDAILILVPQM